MVGVCGCGTDEGKKELGGRDILVALIRGTLLVIANCADLKAGLVSASAIIGNNNNPKVHEGFYLYYTSSEVGSTYNPTSCKYHVLRYYKLCIVIYVYVLFFFIIIFYLSLSNFC